MVFQLCLPIGVKGNNNDQEQIFFTSKKGAVDLQLCLPIAMKGNNNDQELIHLFIFFQIKKNCSGFSIVPSYHCERE